MNSPLNLDYVVMTQAGNNNAKNPRFEYEDIINNSKKKEEKCCCCFFSCCNCCEKEKKIEIKTEEYSNITAKKVSIITNTSDNLFKSMFKRVFCCFMNYSDSLPLEKEIPVSFYHHNSEQDVFLRNSTMVDKNRTVKSKISVNNKNLPISLHNYKTDRVDEFFLGFKDPAPCVPILLSCAVSIQNSHGDFKNTIINSYYLYDYNNDNKATYCTGCLKNTFIFICCFGCCFGCTCNPREIKNIDRENNAIVYANVKASNRQMCSSVRNFVLNNEGRGSIKIYEDKIPIMNSITRI